MRSIVAGALLVCTVAKTRMPKLASWSASFMVSVPRSSPDEHDVRVLTPCAADGRREARRMRADLAVGDLSPDRGVHELDGIFDGQDVARPRLVDVAGSCRRAW